MPCQQEGGGRFRWRKSSRLRVTLTVEESLQEGLVGWRRGRVWDDGGLYYLHKIQPPSKRGNLTFTVLPSFEQKVLRSFHQPCFIDESRVNDLPTHFGEGCLSPVPRGSVAKSFTSSTGCLPDTIVKSLSINDRKFFTLSFLFFIACDVYHSYWQQNSLYIPYYMK